MGGKLSVQGTKLWWIAYLTVITLTAFGQSPLRKACSSDVKKFCGDVKPGPGSIGLCLKDHQKQLSPECKAAWKDVRNRIHIAMASCKPDAEKLCAEVKPGGGRILKCLKTNESKLSPDCFAEMNKMKNRSTSADPEDTSEED